jgi:alpha-tubulin suppressor-like RCC1 family protein
VAGSGNHVCAILNSGQLRCWGYNDAGQLGDDTTDGSNRPVVVRSVTGPGPLTGVLQVDLGVSHTCARVQGGGMRCWGRFSEGQLGIFGSGDRHRPGRVRGVDGAGFLTGVSAIGLGDSHSCAVVSGGEVRCWGDNAQGALGDGNAPTSQALPVKVRAVIGNGFLVNARSLTGGISHTCAVVAGREARCWGSDTYGRLGNGPGDGTSSRPMKVVATAGNQPLPNVLQVAAGDQHTCARLVGGTVRCWGLNDDGQLGDGTQDDRHRPAVVQA